MTDLLRCTHLAPSLVVTGLATALALAAGRGWATLLLAAAVAAGQFSVGWANDWLDAGRDAATGRRDKPVATGRVPLVTVRTAAMAALAVCVALTLPFGPAATAVHLLAVGAGWAYDLGLKSTAASVVPYSGAFALLPVFVTRATPGAPLPPWWLVVAAALLGAGAHFANVLPDLAADARTGVRGLPQRAGARRSGLAAGLLLGGGALVVTFAPPGPARPAGLVGLAACLVPVAGVLTTGLAGRVRAAFPLAMAAAVVAAVNLIAGGL